MIGSSLSHYRILKALGSGGMGEVYAAEDTKLKRQVAVKILPALVASDPERRDRLEREAQTIAALNHPNIVTVHSIEVVGEVQFLTMELVEGKTLCDVIPRAGLPIGRLLSVAIPLADAVASAHQRGVVHRDLKPANVMLTDEGRVKVLDFGLAKLKESGVGASLTMLATQPITAEGKILGTVAYMAPEQAEGKPVDARSDIFSLGVMVDRVTRHIVIRERPRHVRRVAVRSTLLEEYAVLSGEVLTEWSPRLVRARAPMQEQQRIVSSLSATRPADNTAWSGIFLHLETGNVYDTHAAAGCAGRSRNSGDLQRAPGPGGAVRLDGWSSRRHARHQERTVSHGRARTIIQRSDRR